MVDAQAQALIFHDTVTAEAQHYFEDGCIVSA